MDETVSHKIYEEQCKFCIHNLYGTEDSIYCAYEQKLLKISSENKYEHCAAQHGTE